VNGTDADVSRGAYETQTRNPEDTTGLPRWAAESGAKARRRRSAHLELSSQTDRERPELAAPCSSYVPRLRSGFRKPPLTCGNGVGDTGFEPVTSSV
jgi:hypothetical protein